MVGVSKAVSTCDVTITFASTPDNYYVVINGGVGPQGAQGAAGAAGAAEQGVPTGGQPDRSSPRSTAPITTRSGSTRAAEPALWQWRTVVLALHCQHAHRHGAREQLSNDRGGVEWRCDDCAHFRPPSRDGSTETAPGGQKTPGGGHR